MEEGGSDANAGVQTGTDRNSAQTDRGGGGEREVDATGLQIHTQTYCRLRKEYGGLKVEQAKRLKALIADDATIWMASRPGPSGEDLEA